MTIFKGIYHQDCIKMATKSQMPIGTAHWWNSTQTQGAISFKSWPTQNSKLSRKSTATTIKQENETMDELLCNPQNALDLKYLLFSYILANDTKALESLFSDIKQLPSLDIAISEIDAIETNIHDGILENERYDQLYQLYEKCRFTNGASTHAKVDFLELACILKIVYISPSTIEILMQNCPGWNESVFFGIVCNPMIDADTISLLLTKAQVQEEGGSNTQSTTQTNFKLHFQTITVLHEFAKQCENARDRQRTLSKIPKILSAILPDTADLGALFEDTMSFMTNIPNRRELRESNLLALIEQHLLRNITQSDRKYVYKEAVKKLLMEAIKDRKQYKLFLLFMMVAKLNWLDTIPFEELALRRRTNRLFIAHFLLRQGADYEEIYQNLRVFDPKHCAILWVICCHSSDVNQLWVGRGCRGVLYNVIKSNMARRNLTTTMCRLLIKMGADVDQDSPMELATKQDNMRLVRLLIYHNCKLDIFSNPGPYASKGKLLRGGFKHMSGNLNSFMCAKNWLKFEQYNLLKVLVICGIDRPLKADVSELIRPQARDDGKYEAERTWLEDWLQKPSPLKLYCRKSLRDHYGRNIGVFLKTQTYPQKLKDYVRTKYLF